MTGSGDLQAATGEMKYFREETELVNEEPDGLNNPLRKTIEELTEANKDLDNLLNSTEIAILLVDRSQRVKYFTPAAR